MRERVGEGCPDERLIDPYAEVVAQGEDIASVCIGAIIELTGILIPEIEKDSIPRRLPRLIPMRSTGISEMKKIPRA